jgi:hypothetical protein
MYKADHPPLEGMCARTSTRWFDVKTSKKVFTPIPFVKISGKFSINTLCFWTAYPEQIIASLTATVFQRIQKLVAKRFTRSYARKIFKLLFDISALYSVTHIDSFLDRLLGSLRTKGNLKNTRKLLAYFKCNIGANERFVYDQLTSKDLSLWLSFRSTTCRRDKPIMETFSGPGLFKDSTQRRRKVYGSPFKFSIQTWKSWKGNGSAANYAHPLQDVERLTDVSSEPPSEINAYTKSFDQWSWNGQSEDDDV